MRRPPPRSKLSRPRRVQERPPRRNQLLDHDTFYPCQVCQELWPKHRLSPSRDGRFKHVCPNDNDHPTVADLLARYDDDRYFERWDRLGMSLDQFY